jgi:hypothetical protein
MCLKYLGKDLQCIIVKKKFKNCSVWDNCKRAEGLLKENLFDILPNLMN